MSGDREPDQIGQYKILRELGAGGMGTVFLGEHILLGRRAAIKTLQPSLSSRREIVERFFNEARAISSISDPGVVQIFDFGYHVDGTAYIVMEYLEGESLAARVDRLGRLTAIEAFRLARQIATSLGAAHVRGIIHRELKPGNVFVTRDAEAQGGERTKIVDFGICKLVGPTDAIITQTGTMLGTPVYMSPEHCRGTGQVDHRSDIYSVGCALFHMLVGRPPFQCDSVGDYIASHLREQPPAPSSLVPELPAAVDHLVLRSLAKSADERQQTMAELTQAIDDVIADLSEAAREVVPASVAQDTALGERVRSASDGERVGGDGPRSHPWFIDSQAPIPAASADDDEWLAPARRFSLGKWLAFALALLSGLAGGIVITGMVLEAKLPGSVPPPPAIVTIEEPAPSARVVARDDAPPAQVAEAADTDE